MQLIIIFCEAALQGMAFVFMGENIIYVFLLLLTKRLALSLLVCRRSTGLHRLEQACRNGLQLIIFLLQLLCKGWLSYSWVKN